MTSLLRRLESDMRSNEDLPAVLVSHLLMLGTYADALIVDPHYQRALPGPG